MERFRGMQLGAFEQGCYGRHGRHGSLWCWDIKVTGTQLRDMEQKTERKREITKNEQAFAFAVIQTLLGRRF